MRRRRYLRAVVAAGALSLAGCFGDADDPDSAATTERTAADPSTPTRASADPSTGTPADTPTRTSAPRSAHASEDGSPTRTDTDGTKTADTDGTPTTDAGTETTSSGDGRDDFLWTGRSLWGDEPARENLFAYAGRHDLAAVVGHPEVNRADIGERIAEPLAAAREHGVEPWLNTGVLSKLTAETFVEDDAARATHLDRLGDAAGTYAEYAPEGRLILWEEAPIRGRWVESGAWNERARETLRELGPEVFAAQKRAIAEAAPGVDVGIFVHFPYIVESKQPGVFAGLMDDLRAEGALPDFVFADFYRGWYEKDAGPGTANRAVRSLITNAREHTGGREVLYMGGAHTINPQHTPSKQSIRMDLRASTAADADGRGWYTRTAYRTTQAGFDPFVPNDDPPERVPDTPRANTATFARDRYQYAYAALREARTSRATRAGDNPGTFDLWLVGEDFSFYDHRLSLRTDSGEWAFVGDFNGYPDGVHASRSRRDSNADPPDVSIFRGLDRDRFLRSNGATSAAGGTDGGTLELAVETDRESTGTRLRSVHVTYSGTAGYLTEPAAARVLDERDGIDAFALGEASVDAALRPGGRRRVRVPVADDARRPLVALRYPEHADAIRRLRAAEKREGFDPRERFDLWVVASGLDRLARPAEHLFVPSGSSSGPRRTLAEAGVVVSTTADGAVASGLDRARLLDRVGEHGLVIDRGGRRDTTRGGRTPSARGSGGPDGVALQAVYAMPYFGGRNFVSAAQAVGTVAADRAAARTYSLEHTELG